MFGSRGLYCYDLDGKLIWPKRPRTDAHAACAWGGKFAGDLQDTLVLFGITKADSYCYTSITNWRATLEIPRDEKPPGHALVIQDHDRPVIVTSATKFIRANDLQTGECFGRRAGFRRTGFVAVSVPE